MSNSGVLALCFRSCVTMALVCASTGKLACPRQQRHAHRISFLCAHGRALSSAPQSTALRERPRIVSVVGAPMSYGQPLAGCEKAPGALRRAGLSRVVTSLGYECDDRGDVDIPLDPPNSPSCSAAPGLRNADAVGRANHRIYEAVRAAASPPDGRFVLTLGGDHSVAMGSLAAIATARPATGVVWVDAHADVNAPHTSPSGNVHGMPLSFLLRHGVEPSALQGYGWLSHTTPLTPSSLVYIGLRDIDAGEKEAIRSLGIRAFTMRDIDKYGIGRVMAMALDHLLVDGVPGRPLHLSYDIDAVDPSIAPSTGTCVPGGLNYREAHFVAEACAETGLLGSMDLVEINPDLPGGVGNTHEAVSPTVALGLELVASALGKSIL